MSVFSKGTTGCLDVFILEVELIWSHFIHTFCPLYDNYYSLLRFVIAILNVPVVHELIMNNIFRKNMTSKFMTIIIENLRWSVYELFFNNHDRKFHYFMYCISHGHIWVCGIWKFRSIESNCCDWNKCFSSANNSKLLAGQNI